MVFDPQSLTFEIEPLKKDYPYVHLHKVDLVQSNVKSGT